jgi:hypothetical protein
MPFPRPLRPHVDLGQEDVKAFCCQLVVDQLLTVAPRVKCVPKGYRQILRDFFAHSFVRSPLLLCPSQLEARLGPLRGLPVPLLTC